MPGTSNFFLPPGCPPPSSTFDTKELKTALQDYETSIREQQLHDHQFTQLQTLTEVAEAPTSSAIVPGAIPKKRGLHRDSTRVSSRSDTTSWSSRRNKNVLQAVNGHDTSLPKRCELCGVTETPRWRANSVGTGLLCNVCGLVQTKRIARKNLTLSRESTSTMGSSHQ
ncbi:hypothetical protein HYE67_006461 [Fusarium culmorum]|uniref:GATA-type domain-containing protein n=1 Tax=Fusarium culmorum TaxID=5516 RepID=A0A2T4H291_FUSCU|nr:hypothetical protein FCULG_00007438 [Fusarium culmorum]QPC64230.1 hypothetical protein HYE67_006461 [Fusarium culmorum]